MKHQVRGAAPLDDKLEEIARQADMIVCYSKAVTVAMTVLLILCAFLIP